MLLEGTLAKTQGRGLHESHIYHPDLHQLFGSFLLQASAIMFSRFIMSFQSRSSSKIYAIHLKIISRLQALIVHRRKVDRHSVKIRERTFLIFSCIQCDVSVCRTALRRNVQKLSEVMNSLLNQFSQHVQGTDEIQSGKLDECNPK